MGNRNMGNRNNQSLVLVSQSVSTWKPWSRFKLSLSLIIRHSSWSNAALKLLPWLPPNGMLIIDIV